MVAALARGRRCAVGQRAPDAARGPVRAPPARLGAGARDPGDRLQGRRAQASDRRGVPGRASGRPRGRVPDPGGPLASAGVEGRPVGGGRDPPLGEDPAVRQPLLVSHHRPDVGACDDQDQRPPAVRCAGDAQRPRVRRGRGARSGHRLHEGGQLLHPDRRPRAPRSDRRHLVRTRDHRASEPGHRPLDLHRVPVLRAGQRRAAAERLSLRVLDLPGRVQP